MQGKQSNMMKSIVFIAICACQIMQFYFAFIVEIWHSIRLAALQRSCHVSCMVFDSFAKHNWFAASFIAELFDAPLSNIVFPLPNDQYTMSNYFESFVAAIVIVAIHDFEPNNNQQSNLHNIMCLCPFIITHVWDFQFNPFLSYDTSIQQTCVQ